MKNTKQAQILGVKIDQVRMDQAIEAVSEWIYSSGKHLIVTPNIEFIIKAQSDPEFKNILNNADLSIPDSGRFGWAIGQQSSSFVTKLLKWPTFLLGNKASVTPFPVVTGTDLMDQLCQKAALKGWNVGLLGGGRGIAQKTKKTLVSKYPGLQISFAEDGGMVSDQGIMDSGLPKLPKLDLLFVAFGQGKQEKWIKQNLSSIPVKVAMGVGGAFDYLSGSVPRAPLFLRTLGLEWVYRLIVQPWRITRFKALIQFVFLMLVKN